MMARKRKERDVGDSPSSIVPLCLDRDSEISFASNQIVMHALVFDTVIRIECMLQ